MTQALLKHLERADSGLFIHAPDGTCQRLAEALGEAGKTLAGLTETEDSQLAIEQLADQLAQFAARLLGMTPRQIAYRIQIMNINMRRI